MRSAVGSGSGGVRPRWGTGRRARQFLAVVLIAATAFCGVGCSRDAEPPDPPGQEVLVLGTTGLGIVDFGDDGATVLDVLRERWGPPVDDHEMTCESSEQARLVSWDGIYLVLVEGRLRGYGASIRLPARKASARDVLEATTKDGIGFGTTLAEARELVGSRFHLYPNTSLGDEWALEPRLGGDGLIGGFLSGTAPDDVVIGIGAGSRCLVR